MGTTKNNWRLCLANGDQIVLPDEEVSMLLSREGSVTMCKAWTGMDGYKELRRVGISILHVMFMEQYTDTEQQTADMQTLFEHVECGPRPE